MTKVALALCFLFAAVSSDCPRQWLNLGNSCYHFSHDKENWASAQTICRTYTAHLVEIMNATENAFLTQEVKRLNATFWIGAADLLYEGEWVWVFTRQTFADTRYSNWAPNGKDNAGMNENCAHINPTGKWEDGTCSYPERYICQRSIDHTGDVFG